MASHSAYENLQRARESLARVRALFEAGRADPWQVAEAELRHDRARDAALDEPEPQLQLVGVHTVRGPVAPLDLAAVDLTLRRRRGT